MYFTRGHPSIDNLRKNASSKASLINLANALRHFKPLELVFLKGSLQRKHPWIFPSFLMASLPAFVAQMLVKTTPRLRHASGITSILCTRELRYPSPFLSRHFRFTLYAEVSRTDERTANKVSRLETYHWCELLSSELCSFMDAFFSRSHCNIMCDVTHENEIRVLKGLLSPFRTEQSQKHTFILRWRNRDEYRCYRF